MSMPRGATGQQQVCVVLLLAKSFHHAHMFKNNSNKTMTQGEMGIQNEQYNKIYTLHNY